LAGGIAGGAGAAAGGSPYTPNPRGPTSRVELKISWEFPTYEEKVAVEEGKTVAKRARKALSAEEAFTYLAGKDHRPLLILRECLKCNGTDNALMTRNQDNERTLVMSRWFHCIKLPPDVLSEDHPFHSLFAAEKPGHLFFSRWDGSERKDLTGQQSRQELWDLMESYLASEYEKGVDTSLKDLLALLDRFDRLDTELMAVKNDMDDLLEKGGNPAKMGKLQHKLAELEAAKTKARAEAVELSEVKLKQQTPKSAAAEAPARDGKG